ncbi:MAG: DUF1015 domain-containing protein [Desulfococcaceae bacterium]
MANIRPFRGIVYNPEKISDPADVTAPPYDVISPQEQEYFHKRHPQNIIRLVLGKKSGQDTAENSFFTRAADYWKQWRAEKILIQDKEPALYVTSIEFDVEGCPITRFGLIATVGLEPFEKKIILPHERTFSKVKTERLELMKNCHANFCSIFSLYSDPENAILPMLPVAIADKSPDTDFTDTAGHRQKMWRVTDAQVIHNIREQMKDKTLFIADGHHRYETALNFREWLKSHDPGFDKNHPANYIMMYLASMQDPGMVILPAHRMLKAIDAETMQGFVSKAEKYFTVRTLPFSGEKGKAETLADFSAALAKGVSNHTIGLFMKNRQELFLLSLKPGVMADLFSQEMPDALLNLDVTVLTRLIFMEILGFDQERLDNHDLIGYSTAVSNAVEGVLSGEYDMTFILNSTRIEQVREVAEQGLIMPRKSTYFYPKVITGQVMNSLRP